LTGKIVIVVKDIVKSKDSMLACIASIKKQRPGRVIVAVPLIREKAEKAIEKEVDDLVFLKIENRNESTDAYYENFPKVADDEVRHILNINRRRYPALLTCTHFYSSIRPWFCFQKNMRLLSSGAIP
jgi:putative phosphoribosyl transferase